MNMKKILPICCVLLALLFCLGGCVTVEDPEKTLPTQSQSTDATRETDNTVQHTDETTEATTEATTATTEETVPETSEEENPPATTESGEQEDEVENTTEPNGSGSQPNVSLTLQEYNAMTAEEQYAFFMSFKDPADFFAWQAKAKAEDEAMSDDIVIDGNTNVDMGDIVGGK